MLRKLSTLVLIVLMIGVSLLNAEKGQITNDYIMDKDGNLTMWVYVWGEVNRPGAYLVLDTSTLIQLMSLAGGPNDYADLEHIRLTRKKTGEEKKFNIQDFLKTGNKQIDIKLLPGDVLYIPKNKGFEWKRIISYVADVATILTLFILIRDQAINGQ